MSDLKHIEANRNSPIKVGKDFWSGQPSWETVGRKKGAWRKHELSWSCIYQVIYQVNCKKNPNKPGNVDVAECGYNLNSGAVLIQEEFVFKPDLQNIASIFMSNWSDEG